VNIIINKKIIFLIAMFSFSINQDLDDLEFGNENTLDIMTWNIEWFPKNGQVTMDYVGQIIEALEMDIMAIQEVDNINSFNQMIDDLPMYEGYLESSWFAGLAYIYNTETIEINDIYEIYTTSPYWSPFPRSPMVIDFNFMGSQYFLINNHFKCCGDGIMNLNDSGDEETRRYIASNLLKDYIDDNLPNSRVIVLGDLNDILTDDYDNNVFQTIMEDPANYTFTDMEIAEGSSSNWSYPNWPSHIDHIFITNELFDIFGNDVSICETIRIDDYMNGGFWEYDQNISDHRPVALKLGFDTMVTGDFSDDGVLDILDIVILVSLILNDQYNQIGDFNLDGDLDIQDLVIMVNLILS
jgi:endonuclease/exonuclease/phosphatase family metal-dependent hydrolase